MKNQIILSILFSSIVGGIVGSFAGPLAATFGGTGQSSYTTGDLLYASSSTALAKLGAGTSGNVLTANGAGVAPSWQAAAGGGIAITDIWPLEAVGSSGSFTETDEFNASGGLNAKWTYFGNATHSESQTGDGCMVWSTAGSGGNEMSFWYQTISSPTSTFKYRLKLDYMTSSARACGSGIFVRNATNDKISGIEHRDDAILDANRGFYVSNISGGASSNGTTVVATKVSSAEAAGGPYWFEIEQDSTNLYFRCSRNGINWLTLSTQGKTSFISSGATQVGFSGWCIASGTCYPINMHWFRRMS